MIKKTKYYKTYHICMLGAFDAGFYHTLYNIWRGSNIILSWFLCGSPILVKLEFGDVGFVEGGKLATPGKPLEQGENQQQIQPTYVNGLESNLGHIGEKRALSPLRHPFSLDALIPTRIQAELINKEIQWILQSVFKSDTSHYRMMFFISQASMYM